MKNVVNKIRVFFWFLGGFVRKYYQFALLSFCLGIFTLLFYPHLRRFLPRKIDILRIGIIDQTTPDKLPKTILEKISLGLTEVKEDGSASPGLAESWETKEGGKIYLFHLKEGFTWQDEKPLKAEDIHYNFKNVQLEVIDDKTLKVQLDEQFSPLPTLFSQPILKKNYLGLGNYQVIDVKISRNYLQSLLLRNVADKNKLIKYQFYPTLEAAILGFKLGEVDVLEQISRVEDFLNWPNINLSSIIARDQYVAIYFFMQDQYLANKNLRQALAYSIENKEGNGERALEPLNSNSWAYNSQVKPYTYDFQAAQEHFEKFKKEVDLKEKVSLELSTTLSQLETAEVIKKSWEKLDIKVQVRVVADPPREFQAFLASRRMPPDPDQYSLWHSTQDDNLTRLKNFKIDKLLEDGRKEINQEKRKEIYLDFQRFLVEESPAIFLFHPKVWTIERKHLF